MIITILTSFYRFFRNLESAYRIAASDTIDPYAERSTKKCL